MKANPPKTIVTPRKDVTPEKAEAVKKALNTTKPNGKGRNAGKQQQEVILDQIAHWAVWFCCFQMGISCFFYCLSL